MKNRKILRSYKRKFHGGRRTVVRIVDFIFFRLLFVGVFYLWFRTQVNTTLSLWLSVIAMLMVSVLISLINSIRFDKFVAAERKKLLHAHILRQLQLMPYDEFKSLVGKSFSHAHIFPLQSCDDVTRNDMLHIIKYAKSLGISSAAVCATSSFTAEARRFSECVQGIELTLIDRDELIYKVISSFDEYSIEELEKDELLRAEREKKLRRSGLKKVFAPSMALKYAAAAVALFVLSLFTEYALYFKLMAFISLSVGAISLTLPLYKPHRRDAER